MSNTEYDLLRQGEALLMEAPSVVDSPTAVVPSAPPDRLIEQTIDAVHMDHICALDRGG